MTLHLTSEMNTLFTALFNEDFDILKVWANDERVRMTPKRKDILWNRFNEKYDLTEEMYKSTHAINL